MKIRTTGLMVLVGLTLAGWLLASPPGWWAQRGVTTNGTPNDYAAANVGQLKQLAKQAYLEMEAQLPGGAGPEITALINSWSQPPTGGVVRNDFAAVNHGQLKSVAKLFYDRLAQVGDHGAPLTSQQVYPWTADTSDDTSFSPANIGQVKFLFSFDLYDNDHNGLPDNWERQYLGYIGNDPASDPGGVGRTLLQSYQQGLSPWPTPAVPSGLRAWYRADEGVVRDSGSKVSQWTDISGQGFHVVQTADATKQPSWIATATYGQPVVQFDGTTFLKTKAAIDETAGSNDVTVIAVAVPASTQPAYASLVDLSSDTAKGFVVGQLANATNQYQLWFMDAAQSGWNSGPAAGASAGATQVITVIKNGTNAVSYLNGATQGTATVPAAMLDPVAALAVGNRASGNYGYNGQIAEVLVYNRALTATERQSIEAALMTKYINPDADGNGLPDAWENQYLGHSGNDASSDPGGVGRTLLQSYQQNLSPWPTPAVASGLRSWFKASLGVVKDANNAVSQWTDLSGNGAHLVQSGALEPGWSASPVYNKPAVQFSGTTFLKSRTAIDELAGSSDVTVITVAVPDATQPAYASLVDLSSDTAHGFVQGQLASNANQFQLWFMDAAQSGWYSGPAAGATAGQAQVVTTIKNGVAAITYLNGLIQGTGAVPASMNVPVAALAVGNRASGQYGFSGKIAEVLVYNRALTDAERASIEAQLMSAYIDPDSNGNGIPDSWELQYLGNLGYSPTADPGGVGRTLLQSYQQGLSPWPTPVVANGLRSWFSAGQGVVKNASNKVSQWTDLSGHGFHVGQTGALQPVWVAAATNNQPVVQFDGTTFLKSTAAVDETGGSNDVTVIAVAVPAATQPAYASLVDLSSDTAHGFVVGQLGNATNQFQLWFMDAAQSGWNSGPAVGATAASAQVISVIKNGTNATSYLNGTAQGSATVPAAMLDPVAALAVGNRASGNYGYNGQIAEVLVYNRALTDIERQSIEAALTAKYIFTPFDPTQISGLRLLLKADAGITVDSNGKVSAWQDQSTQGNNVSQATAANRPAYQASSINGKPALRFTGTEFMTAPIAPSLKPANITMLAVYKLAGNGNYSRLIALPYRAPGSWNAPYFSWSLSPGFAGSGMPYMDIGTASGAWNPIQSNSATTFGTTMLLTGSHDGSTSRIYVNGVLKNTVPLTGAISYGTATNFHVGNDPFGEYFNGDIAEVLVYDHALTDDEQFQLGTYLNDKYQLPGVVVPSAPTSVTATAISSSRVNVTWQPGTTTSPIMHYVVERKGGSGSFIKIAELPDSLSYLDSGVTSGTSYTYRISARSYAGTSPGTESNAVTVTAGGLGFSEEGLQLWLRADAGVDTDSTGKVTRWKDLSGNGRDVTQATASSQPTYQASSINNLPAVRFSFDGSGKFLTGSANAALKPANITIFAVHKMNGGGNSPSIVAMPHHDGAWSAPSPSWALYAGYGNPSNRQPFAALAVGSTSYQNFTSTTTALNATTMVFASYDGTASRVYLNGVLKNTVTVSGALAYGTTNSFYVGSNPGNEFMDGDIAEIMVFDRALGPIERQAVSNYLNQRYAYNTTATPPATPTNLTADAVSGTQVALAWDAVSAAEEVSYTLERKTGAGAYAPIAQLSGVSGYFDGTVQPGTGYTYRLKASSLGGASSYSNEASVTTPATGIPVPLAGMRLWLKADTVSAGAVSVWPDFSGHHNDASQTNAALQPLKVSAAINGRPAVRFDGSNDYLAFGDLMAGATAGEVFIVLKNSTASPTRNNNLWYFTRGSYHPLQDKTTLETFATSEDIYGPEPVQALDQPHLYNVSGQSGSWTSWINGSVYLSRATNTVPAFYTAPQLGWAGYGGDIAEVIIYDHALTTAEREAVGGYLNRRFAFIAAAPATPGALAASAVSGTQVSLTWSGVQNGSGTIYTLERKTGSGGYAVLAETEALSYFDATAVADTAYTYRVKARNLAGESGYSNEAGATTPASGTALPVSGMRLWLKADTLVSEGRVGIWFDQSGSHHDATQQNSILQPLLVANAINGRPAVRFDGSNDYLALGDFMNGATAGEVFVVLKNSTAEPTRNNGLWFITGGSYHPLQDKTTLENFATNTDTYGPEPVQALDQPHLYNVSGQNGSWASWINGSLYLSKSTNTVPTFSAAAQLGWNGYGGDIAEIIIYDHALTAAEREVVGRYLNQRHAFVPAVPANPTNLTAQALASTQVNLSWSAALTGKGTIFTVERRTGTDPFAPVADVADSLSFIDATAASDMTYTYRVTARNLAGASGYSNEASATTATSGGVAMPLTGIRLWLKADAIASTGPVGTWLDQSGNRNHGTQLNAVFQPQVIANALNGRPVVRFDGANDVFNLSPAMMAGATEGEVLVVLKTAAAALPGDNGLWYFGGTDGNYYPLTDGTTIETFGTTVAYTGPVPAQPLNQYHLYNVSAQAGAWMSSLNGVPYVVQSTNTVTFGASAPTLGRGHNFFSGDIAEIIVYDHALSATERETAERYFNQRYQLTPSPFTAVNDFAYDSDGDGLSNAYELAHGLNPYNRDSDGDGIPDGWEIAHGLNPLDPSDALQLGANGLTNLENYYNDTGTTGASVKLKVFQPAQR